MPSMPTKPMITVGARVPEEVAKKIAAAAARLRTDRSTLIRWVLEEMPAGFSPKPAGKGKP